MDRVVRVFIVDDHAVVLDGLTEGQVRGGVDIGASANPAPEAAVREPAPRQREESLIDGPTGANY